MSDQVRSVDDVERGVAQDQQPIEGRRRPQKRDRTFLGSMLRIFVNIFTEKNWRKKLAIMTRVTST
jgi:hypothetical protein